MSLKRGNKKLWQKRRSTPVRTVHNPVDSILVPCAVSAENPEGVARVGTMYGNFQYHTTKGFRRISDQRMSGAVENLMRTFNAAP